MPAPASRLFFVARLPAFRRFPIWLLGGLALSVSACSGPLFLGATTAASLGSLGYSKKTLTDHVYSAMVEKDCSMVALETTGEYCPPPPRPVDYSKTYCYRSIGDVDCYDIPDPGRNHNRPIADPHLPPPPAYDIPKPLPRTPPPVAAPGSGKPTSLTPGALVERDAEPARVALRPMDFPQGETLP